jgi:hypothetical protein
LACIRRVHRPLALSWRCPTTLQLSFAPFSTNGDDSKYYNLVPGAVLPLQSHQCMGPSRSKGFQPLGARSSSAGGWVLVNPTCPSGSTACPSVLDSNAATCCPNDMTCQYDINLGQHYCCPSGMPLSHSTPLRRDRETNNQCYCRFQLPIDHPSRPGVC